MPLTFEQVTKVDMSHIPDGRSGEWYIDTVTVPPQTMIDKYLRLKTGRGAPAGTYKRLIRDRKTIMSNTPDEMRDAMYFTSRAHGHILINGLGLGCVITVLLLNPEVKSITVIEKSADVIKLVAPHYKDQRLTIIRDDAFLYRPPKGMVYDFVWHDIWDSICSDNLTEMATLHRKYARKTKWQDSWAKYLCQRAKRRERCW